MKVYVSELPKDCLDCPCYNGEYMKCKLIHCEHSVGYFNENELDYKNVPINQDFEELNCPLQPLSNYTKQVRKEVCDEILSEFDTSNANNINEKLYPPTQEAILISEGFKACKKRLLKKLDQIQGEIKWVEN